LKSLSAVWSKPLALQEWNVMLVPEEEDDQDFGSPLDVVASKEQWDGRPYPDFLLSYHCSAHHCLLFLHLFPAFSGICLQRYLDTFSFLLSMGPGYTLHTG